MKITQYEKKQAPTSRTCPLCGVSIWSDSTHCNKCSSMLVGVANRKVARPSPIVLAKMVKENGFEAVGRDFGVSGKAIQKWCQAYGIPHTKNRLIEWYDENTA